jgi:(p)ppGpp synthase/HD superfamily hydrolase
MNLDVRVFFFNLHDKEVNQKYNKTLPYSFHLEMVYIQGVKFKHLIGNVDMWDCVVIGLFGHDAIEDARLTYNDLKERFGKESAEIIYLCTEEKGRFRSERHSEKYFSELSQNNMAVFVKLCDLIANVRFSFLSNSTMFDKYKNEYPKVKHYLYKEEYKEMFDYLEKIFNI